MDAVALSNHGSRKPCLTLEVKGVKDNHREMAGDACSLILD